FDETDGAALAASGLAQGLEVRTDLAIGLPVVHRLEGRRGHEQEWDAGLFGHGLGHVGLTGSRRTLEQDRPPRRAAHPLTEGLEGEEEVEGLDDFFYDDASPRDVGS